MKWLLGVLILLIFLSLMSMGCSSVRVPDFKAYVTLPASGNGFYVKTVSDEEGIIPKEKWEKMRSRGIVILSEDWAILRNTVTENCLSHQCDDIVGILDELFYTVDDAFKKAAKIKGL